MPADFEAIERYIEISKELIEEEEENYNMDILSDQKVPQGSAITTDEDVMFTNMFSEKQFVYNMSSMLEIGEFPLQNNTAPIHVADAAQDQRVYGADSPKSFMDLDHVDNVSGQELSFYEQHNIKKEKIYSSCSNTDNSSIALSQHFEYNTDNNLHPIIPPEHMDYSSIKEDPEYVDMNYIPDDVDFGQAVVLALKKEISHVCHILDIGSDPDVWSCEDVRKWIVWHGSQFNATSGITEMFNMSGDHLCRLTAEEFRQRSPEAGMNLYAQLDVWKNACKLANPTMSQNSLNADMYGSYVYDNPYVPPAPSASPTPSVSSDDSSSSSIQYLDEEFSAYQSDSPRPRPVETHHKQTTHLWEFLKELLLKPESYSSCIKWLDRKNGIFKIEDSSKVARLWGLRKNRPAMNYDKLSRSIRQYYKKKIIKKTEHSKRLVYQFCQPFL